jgi:hypothetical protein
MVISQGFKLCCKRCWIYMLPSLSKSIVTLIKVVMCNKIRHLWSNTCSYVLHNLFLSIYFLCSGGQVIVSEKFLDSVRSAFAMIFFGTFYFREICPWDTSRLWLGLINTIRIFLSSGHRNFMTWSLRHRAMSTGQHNFGVFLSAGLRAVSQRPGHKIMVSSGQKHLE